MKPSAFAPVLLFPIALCAQGKRTTLTPITIPSAVCPAADSVLGAAPVVLGDVTAYYDRAVDTTFFLTPARYHDRRTILLSAKRPGRAPMAYPNAHFILLITGGAHELLRPYVLPETRALTLVLDDSLRLTFGPMLLIPRQTDPGPIGDVQPRLSTLLSSASLLALARAQTAMALVGQLRFPLSDQELADARALYVAARCVAGGAT